jgi:hypothetical protein
MVVPERASRNGLAANCVKRGGKALGGILTSGGADWRSCRECEPESSLRGVNLGMSWRVKLAISRSGISG